MCDNKNRKNKKHYALNKRWHIIQEENGFFRAINPKEYTITIKRK